jgi:hypothetical protein
MPRSAASLTNPMNPFSFARASRPAQLPGFLTFCSASVAVHGAAPSVARRRDRSVVFFNAVQQRSWLRKEDCGPNFTIHLISRGSKKQLGKGVSGIPRKAMSRRQLSRLRIHLRHIGLLSGDVV